MHPESEIAVLHERQEFQGKELEIMKGEFKEFKKALYELTASIQAIKWLSVGAAGFYLLKELGLVHVLKAVIL